MQRLRPNALLKAARQLPSSTAVSTLPGLQQLTVPCLCALSGSLPSITNTATVFSNITNLRGFAAEACRIEDQQEAAEALFKNAGSFVAPAQQSAAYPFFARAYYVGEHHRGTADHQPAAGLRAHISALLQAIQSILCSLQSAQTRWVTIPMLAKAWS